MRISLAALAALLALACLALPASGARASERRPRVEQDECARRGTQCEQRCDAKAAADRLSCKTDCRLVESQCRNPKR